MKLLLRHFVLPPFTSYLQGQDTVHTTLILNTQQTVFFPHLKGKCNTRRKQDIKLWVCTFSCFRNCM